MAALSPVKILIVNDDPSGAREMARVLQQGGYEVLVAGRGGEVAGLIAEHRPALVLLDVVLPDQPGPEVLRRIRADPDAADVSVVLVSPLWSGTLQPGASEDAGADGYIVRPISPHELLARVRDMLRQRELIVSLRASEARYRSLFDRDLTGNFVHDANGRLTLCNLSFARMHGFETPAACVAANPPLFRDPAEQAALGAELRPGQEPVTHERWIAHRSGASILVVERLLGRWDESGRLLEMQGYHLDITERHRAERAVVAQAGLLSNAQRIGRMGSWSLDIRTDRMVWSDEACALFGIRPEEFKGTRGHFYDFVLPEDRPRLAAGYSRVMASGGALDVETEFRIRKPDGTVSWMLVRGDGTREADGEVRRRFGMFMDVTERKRAEERVLRLNRIYALLSEVNTVLLRIRQRDTLLQEACRISVQTGRMRAAWIGLVESPELPVRIAAQAGALQGYHEEITVSVGSGPEGAGPFGHAVRDNRNVVCNDVEHDPIFLRWRTQALERGFRSLAVFPLRFEEQPIGAMVLYADVPGFFDAEELRVFEELAGNLSLAGEFIHRDAVRRAADAKLRESEERFRAMYEHAPLGICMLSLERRFLRANRRFCEIIGRTEQELVATFTCVDITHPDDREMHVKAVTEVLAGAASVTIEQRYLRPDHSAVWARLTLSALRGDEGRAQQLIGVIDDVSERRALEDQLRQSQRLEAIGQLTGGVAHDFNNLLTVILGNAELLSEAAPADSEARLLGELIVNAALRGADLTQRLLAFARRQPLRPVNVDVNRLVGGLDSLQRRALGEHVEVELALEPGLWPALIDPAQLESALLNLALNARDAMPTGGQLRIATENVILDRDYADRHLDARPGEFVCITVADTGIGIAARDLGRVFEPFFTTKPTGKGTGLGLAMVYGFVRQSDGHIRIESEVGRGTCVYMYLPRAVPKPAVEPARIAPGALSALARGSETILLVEDDDMVRRYARDQLRTLGYRVIEAANGREALVVLRGDEHLDLLFTDVVMPGGISGRQLADLAANLRPGLKVLYSSGYAENAIVHQGRIDPGVLLLEKPYQRAELASKIREALAR